MMSVSTSGSALRHIRVVDLSWVLAGPWCTLLLSLMGAEVIKIESRRQPDPYRTLGDGNEGELNKSSIFNSANYDKKSCTLNLANPEGANAVKELVKVSDVVVENYGHGVMDRFGLDYSSLKKVKPDIIMASISGLGRTGPLSHYASTAMATASLSGMHGLTGYADGEPQNLGGAMVRRSSRLFDSSGTTCGLAAPGSNRGGAIHRCLPG